MKIDDIANECAKALAQYEEETQERLFEKIENKADEIVNMLKKHPKIPERTGKYKKSFYKKTVATGRGYKRVAVANKLHGLTHLLEDSHEVISHGRRTGKRTKAYPHWKDAQAEAEKFAEELESEL